VRTIRSGNGNPPKEVVVVGEETVEVVVEVLFQPIWAANLHQIGWWMGIVMSKKTYLAFNASTAAPISADLQGWRWREELTFVRIPTGEDEDLVEGTC